METFAIDTGHIDDMIQEIWIQLSEQEREEFLKDMKSIEEECALEIQKNIIQLPA